MDKLKLAPVYVRATGESSSGLDGLLKKGALAWPEPQDTEAFEEVFKNANPSQASDTQPAFPLIKRSHSKYLTSVAATHPALPEYAHRNREPDLFSG